MFRLRRSSASLHSGYAQHDTIKSSTYSYTITAVQPESARIVESGSDPVDGGS